ncbi:hypothetical protein ACFWY9_00985 [Amycolatopsis sp. NPDC059027]|uniref:hypothetical protein n=1 Tax=Amycolatopsis sp. NPDC059027 TaxID=3346709 RepID=UPI0036718EB8
MLLPEPGDLVDIAMTPAEGGTQVRITESGTLADAGTSAIAWRNSLSLLRELASSGDADL